MHNISAARQGDDTARLVSASRIIRAALPVVRPLLMAGVVTALIMVGLPTFLAIAASAAIR